MTERIIEEISLGSDILCLKEYENDDQVIEYVFEFDIQAVCLRKKLKDYALKRKNSKVSDQKLVNILGTIMTKGELRAQRNIKFIDMTPDQQAFIRRVLRDSFTQKELELMGKGGLIVRVTPFEDGKAGSYRRKHQDTEISEIHLSEFLTEDTVTHEFVHHARTVDESRTGFAITAYKTVNGIFDAEFYFKNESDIHNLEEASTVAETTARTKSHAKDPSGYFDYIFGISRKAAYNSDRKRLTRSPQSISVDNTKGIKGKAAINCVNEEFSRTHIAAMMIHGRTALRSYEILNQKQ